jgi:N-acetylglucosaminyldiphosphoundecaprenol N-acetyl-beta-D-mannosaminyltransferase
MRKSVVSIGVNDLSMSSVLKEIVGKSEQHLSTYVCVANVHMTIEAYWDAHYAKAVNSADLVVPDGMPIAKAMGFLYGTKQERIAGMDLLPALLEASEKNELGVFFYGGTDDMMDRTKQFVSHHYPDLANQHFYSPPFRELTFEEDEQVISRINSSGVHLVFVVLGCPKQEKWMSRMKGRINACMIGVGGAVPVLIGQQRRAPVWMQKASLEWLYRLMQEPRRLFKRYFVTNSLFLFLILKQWLLGGRNP